MRCKRKVRQGKTGGKHPDRHSKTATHILLCVVASLALAYPGASFSQRAALPDAPQWFWTQSSEGMLGRNIALDWKSPAGYRVWCWYAPLYGFYGLVLDGNARVKDLTESSFRSLNSTSCQVLVKAYGR